jgi:NodT family efflux transporter outer membrane factor (OMF) lipoprotein
MKKHLSVITGVLIYLILATLNTGCRLPQELVVTDTLAYPENYRYIPQDVQSSDELPSWRTLFKDTLLVQLIDTAIRNNLDLKIATQRIYQARAMLTYSKRAFFPSVSLRASGGAIRFGDYTVDGVGNFDTNLSSNITPDQRIPNPVPDYFLGVETSWESGLAGKLRNRKKSALARYLASEAYRQFVQTQLVAASARLYYELLAVDNELKIIRQNLNLQEQALEIINIQKQSGQINELAVKQFLVQTLQTRALEAERMQYLITIENTMNTLLGRFPQRIVRSDTLPNISHMHALTTGIPAKLLQNRPDIREAEMQLNASEAELKAMRASFFPVLNISAYLALNGFNSQYLLNPVSLAYTGFLSFTTPFLNRNQVMTDYHLQASAKNQALYNYQLRVIQGISEVVSSYNRMLGYREVANLKQREVSELKMAAGIANDLFLTGFANYLEVLMVRRNVLEAELQLTAARKEFFHAYIDLYKALGGGWK